MDDIGVGAAFSVGVCLIFHGYIGKAGCLQGANIGFELAGAAADVKLDHVRIFFAIDHHTVVHQGNSNVAFFGNADISGKDAALRIQHLFQGRKAGRKARVGVVENDV